MGRAEKQGRILSKEYLTSDPIFDQYRSKVTDFPAYNWEMPRGFKSIVNVIGKKEESKELMGLVFKHDREKLSNMLELVDNDDWEILAVWFQSTDLVSHLYPGNKLKHMVVYKFADRAVEMTRMKLKGDLFSSAL